MKLRRQIGQFALRSRACHRWKSIGASMGHLLLTMALRGRRESANCHQRDDCPLPEFI